MDAEYRWFLGIPFGEGTPHYSTFSQNYIRRYAGTEVFENIFVNIVEQAIKYNLVKGETFFTDSTHKKANANKNKYHEEIKQVAKQRKEWIEEEINKERENKGKRNLTTRKNMKKKR